MLRQICITLLYIQQFLCCFHVQRNTLDTQVVCWQWIIRVNLVNWMQFYCKYNVIITISLLLELYTSLFCFSTAGNSIKNKFLHVENSSTKYIFNRRKLQLLQNCHLHECTSTHLEYEVNAGDTQNLLSMVVLCCHLLNQTF